MKLEEIPESEAWQEFDSEEDLESDEAPKQDHLEEHDKKHMWRSICLSSLRNLLYLYFFFKVILSQAQGSIKLVEVFGNFSLKYKPLGILLYVIACFATIRLINERTKPTRFKL